MQTLELQVERFENTLTLDHLATLPKRNKDHFLSSFTREQQHFFQQYLYEGQRVARSWDISEPMSPPIINPPASPKNDPQLGFGTPILRARLDPTPRIYLEGSINTGRKTAGRRESSKENEIPSGHGAGLLDAAKHDFKSKVGRQKSRDDKKRLKEHNLRSGSDNELVERHADRRQRKKTKRDIMNAEFSGDGDNKDEPPTTCIVRKQAKRQSKLRQEFALMHGFSSTNVGKNRLTLKPGRRDIGVFQKGKASGKTEVIQVGKRKRQESGFIFSEAAFLTKPRQNVSKIGLEKVAKISTTMEEESSVASSVSVSTTKARTDSDMVKVKSKKFKFKDSKVPSKSNLVSKTKPQNQDKPQTGYNPADSVVWEIEQAELLGSDVSSGVKQGTIVLKLDHLPLTLLGNKTVDTNITTLEAHEKSSQQKSLSVTQSDAISSTSLGPSQSASQIGLKTVDMASLPTVPSKYFKPLAPRLAEPHLALTINQLDKKPSAVSELGEISTIDTIQQMPGPASHFLHSAGPSARPYCDGRPNIIPPMQPIYDLEVSVYECYSDSVFCSPADHPADLGVESLDNVDDIDHISVNYDFDGQINSSVVIPADDEIWPLDYFAGGGPCEMDHTSFIPFFEHESTELYHSIPQSIWPSDAYSEVSERCQEVEYQDSGSRLLSIDMGSEDQQMQANSDFNPKHERASSMDLELHSDVVHQFWQGRSLLYGLSTSGDSSSLHWHKLSNVEADVARQLQLDHWQPQKL